MGERLKERRETIGLTLGQVGTYEGVSAQYLSQLETGKRTPNVWALLGALAQRYRTSADYLLGLTDNPAPVGRINTAAGGHLTRQNLRKMIAAAGVRGCVQKAGVHRFRHTFAINFLRNGGNVLALQDLLGHESMSTVRIYAKLAELDLAAAQRKASPADNWRL